MLDSKLINRHKFIIKSIADKIINNDEEIEKEYIFNETNKEIFNNLFHYFNNSIETNYNLNKGIALIGSIGSGKTTIMRIFQKYIHLFPEIHENCYRITSMNEILSNIMDNKNDILTYNMTLDSRGGSFKNPLNICINEFGAIENIKIYGSDAMKIFENFMMIRYEIFQEYGKKTHITSNLIGKQLQDIFNHILIDRFNEMFEMIPLNLKSFRK